MGHQLLKNAYRFIFLPFWDPNTIFYLEHPCETHGCVSLIMQRCVHPMLSYPRFCFHKYRYCEFESSPAEELNVLISLTFTYWIVLICAIVWFYIFLKVQYVRQNNWIFCAFFRKIKKICLLYQVCRCALFGYLFFFIVTICIWIFFRLSQHLFFCS